MEITNRVDFAERIAGILDERMTMLEHKFTSDVMEIEMLKFDYFDTCVKKYELYSTGKLEEGDLNPVETEPVMVQYMTMPDEKSKKSLQKSENKRYTSVVSVPPDKKKKEKETPMKDKSVPPKRSQTPTKVPSKKDRDKPKPSKLLSKSLVIESTEEAGNKVTNKKGGHKEDPVKKESEKKAGQGKRTSSVAETHKRDSKKPEVKEVKVKASLKKEKEKVTSPATASSPRNKTTEPSSARSKSKIQPTVHENKKEEPTKELGKKKSETKTMTMTMTKTSNDNVSTEPIKEKGKLSGNQIQIPNDLTNHKNLAALYLMIKSSQFLKPHEKFALITAIPQMHSTFGNSKRFLLEEQLSYSKKQVLSLESLQLRYHREMEEACRQFSPSKEAYDGINFFNPEEEASLCQKESHSGDIVGMFTIIYLILNEQIDRSMSSNQIITHLLSNVLPMHGYKDLKSFFTEFGKEKAFVEIDESRFSKIESLVKESPNIINSAEIAKSGHMLSLMTFFIKDIYEYLSMKTSDGVLYLTLRNGKNELNSFHAKIEKITEILK